MSILNDIKKMLGIAPEYTHFDTDIIIHINTTFGILNQIGVGPEEGYAITGSENTWDEFIGDNRLLEMVKTYTYLKVRMIFDTPSSSSMKDAMDRTITELESRINYVVDPGGIA